MKKSIIIPPNEISQDIASLEKLEYFYIQELNKEELSLNLLYDNLKKEEVLKKITLLSGTLVIVEYDHTTELQDFLVKIYNISIKF